MRVRRDQLVLGAVAAALLVAIVAFAATSGVKTEPGRPTPTATPGSERPLFGGSLEPRVRYRTRAFVPPLSFVVGDTEWLVEDATEPDRLVLERRNRTARPGSELPPRSSLSFSVLTELVDPRSGEHVQVDAADLRGWLARHPDLEVGPPQRVTVAGRAAESFHVAVRFRRPARSAAACQALLMVCTLIAPERFYRDGTQMRTIVLLATAPPLVIDLVSQTQRDLEKLEAPAADVLQTLRIG
jgi:hypothetical protein